MMNDQPEKRIRPKKDLTAYLAVGLLMIAAALFLLRHDLVPAPVSRIPVPAPVLPEELIPGDVITFGRYEQDNDPGNGAEPIEWQVLAAENGRALLISRYALDAKPYNQNWRRVTWESSSLRKWLNREFYSNAFSPAEQERILTAVNQNPDNPLSRIQGGNDTKDRIFLLSIDETDSYFSSDEARQCRATAYAKANGTYLNEYKGSSWWWLRSRGSSSRNASLVLFSGYVNMVGYGVNNTGGYIRPAFWLDL